jgi:hypothetical protein
MQPVTAQLASSERVEISEKQYAEQVSVEKSIPDPEKLKAGDLSKALSGIQNIKPTEKKNVQENKPDSSIQENNTVATINPRTGKGVSNQVVKQYNFRRRSLDSSAVPRTNIKEDNRSRSVSVPQQRPNSSKEQQMGGYSNLG